MKRWKIVECQTRRGPRYYLDNGSSTVVSFSRSAKKFDILALLRALDRVGFPLKYTEGIAQINFVALRKYFGWYQDNEIWIDVRPKHRFKTIFETFVHEVAHHIDYGADEAISKKLEAERNLRGRRIHCQAARSDDEYLARGFERFYSIRPGGKQDLRRHHPKLYRAISRLHREYGGRP